jgi:hypothetical protein
MGGLLGDSSIEDDAGTRGRGEKENRMGLRSGSENGKACLKIPARMLFKILVLSSDEEWERKNAFPSSDPHAAWTSFGNLQSPKHPLNQQIKQRIRDNGVPLFDQSNPIYPNSFLHLSDSPLRRIFAFLNFRVAISLFHRVSLSVFWSSRLT